MNIMRKVQLYLPQNIYAEFDLLAEQENKPISTVIRNYIENTFNKRNDKGISTLIKLSKYNLKGGKDLAFHIDEIVYK
ncbi:MAG: hypothetical protein ACYDBX_00885 [Patescibacteria group bacterium]